MKILILTDYFDTGGGAGEIARIQADTLAQTNEVKVLAAHVSNYSPENYELIKCDLDYSPNWRTYLGLYHPKAVNILKTFLKNYRPEECLVHNLNTNWSYHCLQVLHEMGIKTVLFFHDVTAVTPYVKLCGMKHAEDYHYSKLQELKAAKFFFNPFRRMMVRRYVRMATKRVAVSQALADFLRFNRVAIDEIEHNKLPLISIRPSSVYEDSIFFAGRLSSSKGALEAVKYLAVLRDQYHITPKLIVAGKEGVVTEKMRVLASELGVGKQLSFLGWLDRENYQIAMQSTGVVIVPSICFDSFPTVILEAMRLARPVVATIYGGSKEIVDEGQTGFIRDPKNISAFTSVIAKILSDKKFAQALGQSGQKKFIKEFSL